MAPINPFLPRETQERGLHAAVRQYAFTVLICVAIAILVWALGGEFPRSLVLSLAIGLCTHTMTMFGIRLAPNVSIFRIWLLTIPLGVVSGLFIGATLTGTPLGHLMSGGSAVFSLVIALIATYVFYSYYSMNAMQEKLQEQEINRIRSEKMLVETRLRLLQSQIEPHFLFNTLSNVVSLIRSDPPRAEQMLLRLTQFLRASLKRSRSEKSSLQDEINLLTDYLSILKIRMEDRLRFRFDVEPGVEQVPFPPLILQPLVENAIIHGLEPLEEGGSITVNARRVGDRLAISIEDTGGGMKASDDGSGMGMANVKERLQKLYGPKARLDVREAEPQGLVVTIEVPLEGINDE